MRTSSAIFAALSNENRLAIALSLRGGELTVSEIVRRTGLRQSEVSRGLKILKAASVVRMRKVGRHHPFALTNEIGEQIASFVDWHNQVVDAGTRQLLERRERQVAALMRVAPVPVFAVNWPKGEIIFANDAAGAFLGAKGKDALVGKQMDDFLPAAERATAKRQLQKVAKGNIVSFVARKMLLADGGVAQATLVAAPAFLFDEFAMIMIARPGA